MLFRRKNKEQPVKVAGIYHYPADDKLFQDTLKRQWGETLSEKETKRAKEQISRHFKSLYLIEITSQTPLDESDFHKISQKNICQPREDWQAPYDERKLDEQGCHWAFFFHSLNPKRPLFTHFGEIPLPKPSEIPPHLKTITYEAPGRSFLRRSW